MTAPAGRALVVAYDFPPHAAVGTQRTLRLVRHLVETGWDVRVLTGEPGSFRPDTPRDERLLERVPAGTGVLRAATWRPVDRLQRMTRSLILRRRPAIPRGGRGQPTHEVPRTAPRPVRRVVDMIDTVTGIPDAEAGWIVPAILKGLPAVRRWKPDVIYSSAPPWSGHLVALTLAHRAGVAWVADFRDPWARAPWRSARTSPLGNKAAARLERLVVARAAAVILATEAAQEEFSTQYAGHMRGKFVVVPNGCDVRLFDGVAAGQPRPDMFVLLHAGSIYGGRSPSPVLRAAAAAFREGHIDRSRFRLRLVGVMSASGEFKHTLDTTGLDDVVELVPRLSHGESLAEIASASALLLLQQGTDMSIPAKVYEYLAAGRPILALTESKEIAGILRSSGAGTAVLPDDEAGIEAALVGMIQGRRKTVAAPVTLYDGGMRAAEAAAVLRRAIDGRPARAPNARRVPRRTSSGVVV